VAVSVPALIIPTLNQDPLQTCLSVQVPVEQGVIIDNGNRLLHDWLEASASVVHLPHNIGVAASWNLGIQLTPWAPWWLIVNDDVVFGAEDVLQLEAAMIPSAAGLWLFSDALGLAAFAITRHTLNAVGFFDAGGIHPAYNEDLDFVRRVELAGLPRYETGWSGTHVGSATIHSDPLYKSYNDLTHGLNDEYYARKWGGPKQGGETFTTPFNRGGHLGDWRLDIEVLRRQAWRRR
jgi:hypothetical protein